jgi:hypothetical protein
MKISQFPRTPGGTGADRELYTFSAPIPVLAGILAILDEYITA